MKALVIGGGGFVGPYLVRHLTDDCGYEVTVTKTEKEQTRKALILQVGLISVVILLYEDVDTVIGWRKERFTQRARKRQ